MSQQTPLSPDDLRAAVGAGILSEAQAARLAALAQERQGTRAALSRGDEPFELFKGFNEVFIVVGLAILAFGWIAVSGLSNLDDFTRIRSGLNTSAITGLVAIWLLSEYFVRRRRMVAPAIFLSILFAGTATVLANLHFAEPFMVAQNDFSSLPVPLALAVGGLALYWWRFRVPFALALIALGLFAIALLLAAGSAGRSARWDEVFLLTADGPFAWVTLGVGLAVFAVAMAFDMSDPHRVTRRAAQGFWLHVVAAPALVNTAAITLLGADSDAARLGLLGVMLGFALVAIVIDRRSFLIAAIGYLLALAGTVFDGDGMALTILLLGVALVGLGAFWVRVRYLLLTTVFAWLPRGKLPPAHWPR